MVNASDFGSRGRGFEPHSGQTVLCPRARHIYSPKVLVIPRKRWLRPNRTEKLFTGTLRINQPTINWVVKHNKSNISFLSFMYSYLKYKVYNISRHAHLSYVMKKYFLTVLWVGYI